MVKNQMRKKYFIHISSQAKYILMSILPAIVLNVLCIYFLIKTGDLAFEQTRSKVSLELGSLRSAITIAQLYDDPAAVTHSVNQMKQRLADIDTELSGRYNYIQNEWKKAKAMLFLMIALTLAIVGLLALLLSHRLAGPITRLKNSLDSLAEGKDTSPVAFRQFDEFKEVAVSYENLRKKLKEKGFLR
jgi:methyl-accepting chemotaxis protein